MRKTKKRVTAATKLQALARGKHIRSQQKRQNNAVTKLQALARGKRDRRAATAKKQQKQVRGRSAYKSYLSSFTVDNAQKVGGFSGLDLLFNFHPQLEQSLKEHGGLKIHISSTGLYRKSIHTKAGDGNEKYNWTDYNKWSDDELQSFWHTTHIVQITNNTTIKKTFKELGESLIEHVENREQRGSGWVFVRFKNFEIHIARFKPLKGSSYFPLPEKLKLKRAIVNVQNKDEQCFKWAVLSAVFPVDKKTERLSNYKPHEQALEWTGLTFPVTLPDIDKFERRNEISINVYGWEERSSCYILRKSDLIESKQHIDLLLLQQDGKSHYSWIKNFSRFARQPSNHGNGATHHCRYCLGSFPSAKKLETHLSHGCREITEVRPSMPDPEDATVQFKGFDKQIKAPYVIYADFECITEPICKAAKKSSSSYTDAYQSHTPCGFCYHVVSSDPSQTFEPEIYRGEDTINEFICRMKDTEQQLMKKIKTNVPMVMTPQDEINFQSATCCHLCKKELGSDRVRDHDHMTGKFRGAAHSSCNMEEGKKRTRHYTIPVFFHNLKGYDSHLIVSEVGKHTSKLSAIPQNYEKFISFSFSHLKFLDSMGFLMSSLDSLSKNLLEKGKGKHKFKHTARHCSKPEHLDMLLQKGVYPYDYMSSWSRFDEPELPAKAEFYSKLAESHITDEEYEHGQEVWKAFDCHNLGDYHDLYMQTDVLLLADVFEEFRSICLDYYGLDPAHYFTTPNLAWDAMLKKTGVKLQLLTDYDMHLMVEQGLRGGIAMITHRHAEANNPYMKQGYDDSKEHSYISYLDANNLYGMAMVQPLPISNFEWSDERDADQLISRYADNETEGCFVKCDLEYPEHLHDQHNDYPLAPERKLVTQDMLSPYAAELQSKLQIGKDTCEKLVPNLMDKDGYVVDIRNLKFYRDHGLIIKKVHAVIAFKQERWMKPYIDFNTEKRKQAKNDFEKDFFKLMCNSCFGKTMENLRNRVDMSFVTSNSKWGDHATKLDRTVERRLASPLYDGHIIYNEDLVAIKQKKKELLLNKPIYAGMAILDLSKLHMYTFHYDVIKKQYGNRAKLLFTDTDSLCYQIKTDDFYQDMQDSKHHYDFSGFDKTSKFYDESNKKVLGKFKDECDGVAPSEFIGLRPKMYSLLIVQDKLDNNGDKTGKFQEKPKQTGKGIQKAFLKKNVTHAHYKRCLLSDDRVDQQQLAAFQTIRSNKHQIHSLEINKVGLCCYDNKRYLLDKVNSLSYGHYKITELKP